MRCSEIVTYLEKLAPPEYACEWDNPGFQVGRSDKDVKRVLVALDATDEVIRQAEEEGADMIVTHHPLIFKPLRQVNDENFISRRVLHMIRADLCYFVMHTNFDIAPGCMADLAAERLGMIAEEPLETTAEADGVPVGIGKVGWLSRAMTGGELAGRGRERFDLPFVTVYGTEQVTQPLQRIAISPGSGGSMVGEALRKGVSALITGDIGHHDGIDAAANHMAVIDAGHYGLEHIFIPFVAEFLEQISGGELSVIQAREAFPARLF
ncbi:MAG: Nif3-like dinuclear metal center hexameric protein [Clostridiales bacterium]|nr:Nif3-like dinuclear metal center hexameric protein [Clostridiales bacterium]